jgi:hypothetical protein
MLNSPTNTPQFIREREAWYRAGANAMAGYMFIAVLVLGAAVSLAVAVLELDSHSAIFAFAITTLLANAAIGAYLGFTARQKALAGDVQIDQF